MAKAFRPCVLVSVPNTYQGEFEANVINGHISRQFATYTELKTKIRALLVVSNNNELRVYRSRRGEWGEWFEVWQMVNNKPKIIKQGWL